MYKGFHEISNSEKLSDLDRRISRLITLVNGIKNEQNYQKANE